MKKIGSQWTEHGSETPHSGETWMAVLDADTPSIDEMKNNELIYLEQF